MAEKKKIYLGTGRRKTSVARVRVTDGKGKIEINGRTLDHYFTEEKDRFAVLGPLVATELAARVDVIVKVHGGGITGQAGAICQGVARAIKTMFSPTSEQKSYTFTKSNITVIRSYKAEKKQGEEAKPVTTTDDNSIGMIKKIRESGFLTRDSRMKERKKYGLRGARRGTQFSKR
jgi:small subunit ribosomal protein S9